MMHAAGCFVRTVNINTLDPAVVSVEDEGRVQCLGYNSWRYVIIGVGLYAINITWCVFRSHRKTTVTSVIAHPERTLPLSLF